MLTKLIPTILTVMIMTLSCADDKEVNVQSPPPEEPKEEDVTLNADSTTIDSTFQSCDSVYIATYHGNACCTSGPILVKPGDIATYHYQIKYTKDQEFLWVVDEGEITIIKGQGTHTVTVQFGPNFTTGLFGCTGSGVAESALPEGVRLACQDRCRIRTQL